MVRVHVDSIRVNLLTQHRVVILRESESRRHLPIWIDPFVADSIAMAIQGHEPVRPLTHDLLKSTIGELGGSISYILVSDVKDQVFYARIVVTQRGHTLEIDSRPSDAIALAVRTDVPIYVAPAVLDEAGVYFDEDEQVPQDLPPAPARAAAASEPPPPAPEPSAPEPEATESDISLFRNFINTLDLGGDKDKGKQ
jgi:bifunctional DNase/RNase